MRKPAHIPNGSVHILKKRIILSFIFNQFDLMLQRYISRKRASIHGLRIAAPILQKAVFPLTSAESATAFFRVLYHKMSVLFLRTGSIYFQNRICVVDILGFAFDDRNNPLYDRKRVSGDFYFSLSFVYSYKPFSFQAKAY